ncbi:MAG TPA: NAD-dependent epimerase/dehydratase family protein [Terriglobales bacterium]|nr:NAD-dependent epimerase/dehydratase family protein [Terriglobales bacterium]
MPPGPAPTVLITGVAGNLGRRLAPQLSDFRIVGVDMFAAPPEMPLARFEIIDLGDEASCPHLVALLRETNPSAVVHLAFVIDPVRSGVLELDPMWRINVAGTARVMEAIAEHNRTGGAVRRFLYPSSVSAYGSDLPGMVTEDYPLGGHTLPYAVHKREADEVVRQRAFWLGACSTWVLRPPIFAGASVENYLVGGFRGTPSGTGRLAAWMRKRGWRLPFPVPFGERYLKIRFQFVHVDDVARLLAWILRRTDPGPPVTVLNVAGRGEPLTLERCLEIGNNRMVRVPGRWGVRRTLALMWKLGISAVPPEAMPYITSSYLMDLSRLRELLGADFENVIRYTVEEALVDTFRPAGQPEPVERVIAESA